ncbi:MAG: Signal transduction histidine kinase [Klenkia sp.]|nr:Signal transduction histidine kinase [Klenkia sp.]
MTREWASPVWPAAAPPAVADGWSWSLSHVAELPGVRSGLRRLLVQSLDTGTAPEAVENVDRVVLAFDEMASNALRHGGSAGATATVSPHGDCWLVEVRDAAGVQPPAPAVGRDPGQGGLGLHLIAEMSLAHGWHPESASKVVWALLPR